MHSLNHAVRHRNLAEIRDLVRRDHNVNVVDVFGESPLEIVIEKGDQEIFEIFLDNCRFDYLEALRLARESHQRAIEDLIVARANVPNSDLYTPLHLAAQNGDEVMMGAFLSSGGYDVNQSTSHKYSPLHIAIQSGHFAVAKLLLEHDANANQLGPEAWRTLLHTVIERGDDAAMAGLLLTHGATVSDELRDFAAMFHREGISALITKEEIEGKLRWTPDRAAWVSAVVRAAGRSAHALYTRGRWRRRIGRASGC